MAGTAQSPDLNPIEHLRDVLRTRLRGYGNQSNNLGDAGHSFVDIWKELDRN